LTVQEVATLTARCEALQDQLGTAEGTIELLKRRALQAEQRSEVLEAALEDVNAFLKHIEWNDTTSEHDAENLRHQIDVALSTLDPTP
jgi:predicted  nucleic acid-binding Zn-ribbon protein